MSSHSVSRRPLHIAIAAALVVGGFIAHQQVQAQAATSRYPITDDQRRVADQVANLGVPLSALAPTAPDTYTVKSGDTLWDISSVFLTTPWRWPELWGMNRAQVSNPHLIYPGQMLRLVRSDGRARLEIAGGQPGDVLRLSPKVRDLGSDRDAISSIPANLIEPFLAQPAVVAAGELEKYPRIIATQEGRVFLGRGDTAYARGVNDERIENYSVFRPARPLYDPDDLARKNPIAYEAFHLGSARVAKAGEVTTLNVQSSTREIGVGDRLIPVVPRTVMAYVPRSPDKPIEGRIVSIYSGLNQTGTQSIVTLNRGARHGIEIGHVLALLETGPTIRDRTSERREFVKLPDEPIGEMFVFRVFEDISYALVMRVTKPVAVGDSFTQPGDLPVVATMPGATATPAVSAPK